MRKVLSVVAVLALVATQVNTVAFGAYGGGSSTVSYGGGGGGSYVSAPTSFLTKDNCPNGDYSSSYYDGVCGTAPVAVTPTIVDKVVSVIAPIMDKLLETGPKGTGAGYGTGTETKPVCVPANLNDVATSSNASSINVLVNNCIVRGNKVSFLPKSRVTTSEYTKVVMKSLGIAANYDASFQSAKNLGIIPASARPNTQVTRTQAYNILRAALKSAKKTSQIKIPTSGRGFMTREEMAQLVVSAIGSKNIVSTISHE